MIDDIMQMITPAQEDNNSCIEKVKEQVSVWKELWGHSLKMNGNDKELATTFLLKLLDQRQEDTEK